MRYLVRYHLCGLAGTSGAAIGLLASMWLQAAHAQDPVSVPPMSSAEGQFIAELLVQMFTVGGLPAVLAWLGWWFGRQWEGFRAELRDWQPTVRMRLHEDDAARLSAGISELASLRKRVDELERTRLPAGKADAE